MSDETYIPEKQDEIHSPTGASSMERWEVCPGSVALVKTVTPAPVKSYTQDGIDAHMLGAQWLKTGKQPAFHSKDMYESVKQYVEKCQSYMSPTQLRMGAKHGIEYRFDHSKQIPGMYGTSDYWAYWPWRNHLTVLDYKNGSGLYVPVQGNVQVQYYALGVCLAEKLTPDTVELGIVQPRCMREDDEKGTRTWEIKYADLLVFKERMITAIKRTQDPNAPLVSGPHCRKTFCPAAGICPRLQADRDEALRSDFAPLATSAATTLTTYKVEDLSAALKNRPKLKAYLKGLDEFAYQESLRGVKIPGFKLVPKRATRKWVDEDQAASVLEAIHGETVYQPRQLRSPAQIEDLDKNLSLTIELLAEKTSSGYSLVEDSDDRTAIDSSAEAHFAPLIAPIVDPFA